MKKIIIKELEHVTQACPSQWKGITSENESVYIRLRGGYFSLEIDGQTYFTGYPPGFDGVMDTAEMKKYVTYNTDIEFLD